MKDAKPDDIPHAKHESEQEIFGVNVRSYVLGDGRRIINADDFYKVLAAMGVTSMPGHD